MEPNSHLNTQTRTSAATYDEGLRSYMLRVYNYMAMGVGLTGVVTLMMANSPALMQTLAQGLGFWLVLAAVFAMGWFSPKILTMQSTALAQAYYWIYAALWAVLISPIIYHHLNMPNGVHDIARAFFITTGMFAGISLLGYTTKRDLSPLGQFCFMAIIGLIIAGVVQMIFFEASTMFSLIFSSLAVLLFAGMTAYETQAIKDMYVQNASSGETAVTRMAVFGALMIYGNFVVMFIHILNILGIMRE